MPKTSAYLDLATVQLDPAGRVPMFRQLYTSVREAILSGRLAAGTRLPPTRVLCEKIGVSRNTVVNAFEQLFAEGYLDSRVGAGTYVSHSLPDEFVGSHQQRSRQARPGRASRSASAVQAIAQRPSVAFGALISPWRDEGKPKAFRTGVPALEEFPFEVWGRLTSRLWRSRPSALLAYGDAAGYRPLRQAIADYLGLSRGAQCDAEQIIIVAGSQQALDLVGRVLLNSGDAAWLEEPGYRGARAMLMAAGAHIVPVPVDAEGLSVEAGIQRRPNARIAYITPSHQYPLGVTMSLARRLQLLDWANRAGAWIIEDDYDSEYRYAGRPLSALQGLDTSGRVIYMGTFSKVLFPALRLGYLVVPPELVDAFASARALIDRHSPSPDQAVLAEFIAEGHFARHLRRMHDLYAERQAVLVDAAGREMRGLLDVRAANAGLHLAALLPESMDDQAVSARAAKLGVEAAALSLYAMEPLRRGGLVLGYAGVNERDIRDGVTLLAKAMMAE